MPDAVTITTFLAGVGGVIGGGMAAGIGVIAGVGVLVGTGIGLLLGKKQNLFRFAPRKGPFFLNLSLLTIGYEN